jgi:hypothetical protein
MMEGISDEMNRRGDGTNSDKSSISRWKKELPTIEEPIKFVCHKSPTARHHNLTGEWTEKSAGPISVTIKQTGSQIVIPMGELSTSCPIQNKNSPFSVDSSGLMFQGSIEGDRVMVHLLQS